jgi:biopolymer transport protein ExbD
MDWIVRVDVIVLGLMLTYVIGLWIRGVYICCSQHNKSRSAPRKLNFGAKTLHSILAVAPFWGLAGSCFGILEMFRGFSGEVHAVRVMMSTFAAAALVPAAMGLAIGVIAQFVEWFLRGRIDAAKLRAIKGFESTALSPLKTSYFGNQKRVRFPLQARFSQLPAFPIFAAPSLILLAAWFIPFHVSLGFHVRLTKPTVLTSADSLPASSINIAVVLGRAGSRNVYVNGKPTQAETLRDVLLREDTNSSRTTFVQAEGDVRWADVAEVIDAAKSSNKDVVLLTTAPDIGSGRAHYVLKPKR